MDAGVEQFLERHHAAAMATLRPDGTPHVVRVGVGLVDGRLWSSGTQNRVRTGHLRRDPRSTLFVFDPYDSSNAWNWLGLETTVTILEGSAAPEANLRLFRVMQGQPATTPRTEKIGWAGQERTTEDFLRMMEEEQRLIYEFTVTRHYGMF
ncbi:MAG: pyridoxamine 5'-phosphate oxidase family protein [Actinobacteria bacterium]|nr:pyridoxamine 5'-phosphate oxidase family protein [Actinomycetota bacterium]